MVLVVVPYSSVKVIPILFTKMYFSLPFIHCILWETIQFKRDFRFPERKCIGLPRLTSQVRDSVLFSRDSRVIFVSGRMGFM